MDERPAVIEQITQFMPQTTNMYYVYKCACICEVYLLCIPFYIKNTHAGLSIQFSTLFLERNHCFNNAQLASWRIHS